MDKRTTFTSKFGVDLCPGHCKILVDAYGIDYCSLENSPKKDESEEDVEDKHTWELSTLQAYQFKMVYNLDDAEWNGRSFEHAKLIRKEMNDSNTTSSEQETTPTPATTSSSPVEELQILNLVLKGLDIRLK